MNSAAKLSPARRRNLEALIVTCEQYCRVFGFEPGSHPLEQHARLELQGNGAWLAEAGLKVHGAQASIDRLERHMKAGISVCGRSDIRADRARSYATNRAIAAAKARA